MELALSDFAFRVGFCVLKAKADGTLAPGDLKKKLNVCNRIIAMTLVRPTSLPF